MALVVRIDVDRAFGREPAWRHVLSRLASDVYFPRIACAGYLRELAHILSILNERDARAYAFFRRCSLPSTDILKLLHDGEHRIGLHLEDSRSYESFHAERVILEEHIQQPVTTFSKHGSGGAKFGRRHYAPYEPEKYISWGRLAKMAVFLGNLENPTIAPFTDGSLTIYPSAFWLEPAWRDTRQFTVEWLVGEARRRDIVLLIHPENVLANSTLLDQFTTLVSEVPTTTLEPVDALS